MSSPVNHSAVSGDLLAEWHDGTPCCHPGWSCWVASIHPVGRPSQTIAVFEADDEAGARAWALAKLRAHTGIEPRVES